jgi:hypothetical protein
MSCMWRFLTTGSRLGFLRFLPHVQSSLSSILLFLSKESIIKWREARYTSFQTHGFNSWTGEDIICSFVGWVKDMLLLSSSSHRKFVGSSISWNPKRLVSGIAASQRFSSGTGEVFRQIWQTKMALRPITLASDTGGGITFVRQWAQACQWAEIHVSCGRYAFSGPFRGSF